MPDPLSDVLDLLRARSLVSTGLKAGGDWAVKVSAFDGLKFNAVVTGQASLMIEGHAAPVALGMGDCFLLCRGSPFVLAGRPGLPATDAAEVFGMAVDGFARIGDADEFEVVGGKMVLDDLTAPLLTAQLPDCVVLRSGSDGAETVQWLLRRFVRELDGGGAGGGVATAGLMHLMFIELIRAHLATGDANMPGWLSAQRDARIGRALHLMHDKPGRAWRLVELAEACSMSRSSFSDRFRAQVGTTALDYLTRWRMQLARRDIRRTDATLSVVAERYGYASESAFGHAYKRVFGSTPGEAKHG